MFSSCKSCSSCLKKIYSNYNHSSLNKSNTSALNFTFKKYFYLNINTIQFILIKHLLFAKIIYYICNIIVSIIYNNLKL